MPILVTGGAGFIGSHVVRWLLSQGRQVRVLDNFSSGRRAALADLPADIDLITGDIREAQTIRRAVENCELIFHLAAMVSVPESVERPLEAQAINATGTLLLLEAARAAGVRRVVQASSCAVYGNTERLPVSESDAPEPLSPYAATKLAAEQLGQLYSRLYGLETVALRFFNVYGAGQSPDSAYAAVIPRFVAALSAGQQPTIYGDGRQSRDFIYVGDIVAALWTAATVPGLGGGVFNVGCGTAYSLLDLAQTLGELLGVTLAPTFLPARPGDVRHSRADTTLFAARTGFQAQVGLREGLAQMLGSAL